MIEISTAPRWSPLVPPGVLAILLLSACTACDGRVPRDAGRPSQAENRSDVPSQITATFWEKGKPIALDVAASAKAATNAVAVLGSCADGVLRIPAPADLEDLKSLKALELGWPDPQIAKTGLGTMATFDHMVIPLGVENPRLGQVWLSETGTIRAVFAACSLTSLGNLLAMVEGASQGEATPPDEEPPGA